MHTNQTNAFTRRQFLHSGLMLASATASVPAFVQSSALALPSATAMLSSLAGVPQDRVLVVVQLGGGNDGLNTVIPYTHDAYYRARAGIAIPQNEVISLSKRDSDVGLHPALTGIKTLYDQGMCSIVQGVGYPNPNRSHFKSMDIWQTADTSGTGEGWLGRYFDAECSGQPGSSKSQSNNQPGIAIGREAPLAMQGQKIKPISFETADLFRWTGLDVHDSLQDPYEKITRTGVTDGVDPNSNAAFLMRTALDAQVSSQVIRQAVARRPRVQYPRNLLAQQLAMVASMIHANLSTRVYYVSLGGFDTHAGQGSSQGRHANLLGQFGSAMDAFYQDLATRENHKRVLTLAFSEFGRRVSQNASGGTDHGTAAPTFLFGPMVRPGVASKHPSLADLDNNGDLKFRVDFRSIYAAILKDWLKTDPTSILHKRFTPAPVLRA